MIVETLAAAVLAALWSKKPKEEKQQRFEVLVDKIGAGGNLRIGDVIELIEDCQYNVRVVKGRGSADTILLAERLQRGDLRAISYILEKAEDK